MDLIKPPMLYKVQIIKNDYPKQMFDLDLIVRVILPDGLIFQRRLEQNLREYVGHTEMIDMISDTMSCELLEALQKNLQAHISEMILEILEEEKK